MDQSNVLNAFEAVIRLHKRKRIHRLVRSPIKLILPKILELVALWTNRPLKIKANTFWDDNITVVIPEFISLFICSYGFFEEGLTKIFLEYIKPGMKVFDIGAHFGYFTSLSSFLVTNSGQIHSFEPTPSTFNILKVNASTKTNVTINNCAVSSQKKSLFISDFGLRYSSYNSIYQGRLGKNTISKIKPKKYHIDCISIDEYVRDKHIVPNFIKIDAEDSEYDILMGMEKTIKTCHPLITIEVGDIYSQESPKSNELIRFLIGRNYRPYNYEHGKIVPHDIIRENYRYDNILFIPN